MAPKRIPPGLGEAGEELWEQVSAGLELRADERVALVQACRTADTLAGLEELAASTPTLTTGSAGQDVVHPLVRELREQRRLLVTLLSRVEIPAEEGAWDGLTATQRARKASRARWGQAGR